MRVRHSGARRARRGLSRGRLPFSLISKLHEYEIYSVEPNATRSGHSGMRMGPYGMAVNTQISIEIRMK
jgi:hypothetical protein